MEDYIIIKNIPMILTITEGVGGSINGKYTWDIYTADTLVWYGGSDRYFENEDLAIDDFIRTVDR